MHNYINSIVTAYSHITIMHAAFTKGNHGNMRTVKDGGFTSSTMCSHHPDLPGHLPITSDGIIHTHTAGVVKGTAGYCGVDVCEQVIT